MTQDDDTLRQMIETTRASWNERVSHHVDDTSGLYDLSSFLRGEDTLSPIDDAELGDVSGLKIAHLQCHFGMDTLSLARRGAEVSGLDYSSAAIAKAKELAAETDLEATFVCADVYDGLDHLPGDAFDMVFVTCGTICWLPDLEPWAKVVAALLKPGGRLYLCDLHPAMAQLEEEDGKLVVTYPLGGLGAEGALEFHDEVSYAGDGTPLKNTKTFEWIHSLSHILNSLIGAGLSIDYLNEHDIIHWPVFPSMQSGPDGMFRLPDGAKGPPAAFSLMAKKQPV